MPNSHWKAVDTQRGMLTPEGVSYRRCGADMKAGATFKKEGTASRKNKKTKYIARDRIMNGLLGKR
jgi:hypothetical protein